MKEKFTLDDYRRLRELSDRVYNANSRLRECLNQMESFLKSVYCSDNNDNKDN